MSGLPKSILLIFALAIFGIGFEYGLAYSNAHQTPTRAAEVQGVTTTAPTDTPYPTDTPTPYLPPASPTPYTWQAPPPQQQYVPAGATAECADGTYSYSLHRQGTCSYHGGVAEWL
jgi:hypothetical protein